MNNTKKLPTTGIKPAIESFFAISVCHFCNQSGCKGIIFIDYSYSIDDIVSCALRFLFNYILYSYPRVSGNSFVSPGFLRPEYDRLLC